ncbi:MAG: BACON domain-containing protein [Xanthobacteraceae bacterium]
MLIKRYRSNFAKIVGRCLLAGLSSLLLGGPDVANAQESPLLDALVGGWNHGVSGQNIDIRRNGDVWQTAAPSARVAPTIEAGANFAFEGVDNKGRPYRCAYYISFLKDGASNWLIKAHTGEWPCPSGEYKQLAGWLRADPANAPNALTFTSSQGGSSSQSDFTVRLVADGSGFSWSIVGERPDWLSVSPTEGDLSADGSAEVKLSLRPSTIPKAPGSYDATLRFRGKSSGALGVVQRTIRLVVTGSKTAAAPAPSATNEELTDAGLRDAIDQFNALLGPASGKVRVGLEGGNQVNVGRDYRLVADTSINGRLVILDVDADHKVTLIYPNKYLAQDDIGRIEADARVAIPADNYPGALRAFRAAEPLGKGLLLAFVAPEDFQVDRMVANRALRGKGLVPVGDGPSYLLSFIEQVKAWQKSHGQEPNEKLSQWGFGVTDYEIVR